MDKTTRSLESKDFTEKLLGFKNPDEWLQIANGFSTDATNDKFHNVRWAFGQLLKACEEQLVKADECLTVVNDRLEELGIAEEKVTWIKAGYPREFKAIAEKFGYTCENMRELVEDSKRLRQELEENEKKYMIAIKMANDYLYRLSMLDRKINN